MSGAWLGSVAEKLGEVPQRWGLARIKRMARSITEKGTGQRFQVALENVESWTGRLARGEVAYAGHGIAFRPGDVLFGKLRPYLAKVHVAERKGEAVGDFIVMRPRRQRIHPRYLGYLLLTPGLIESINAGTYGAKMPRTSWEDVGAHQVPVPELDEQRRIAAFLDQETRRIDQLVQEHERLALLLAEKRESIVTAAATRGLHVDTRVRDSGIPWLGEVAADWPIAKLSHVASIRGGLVDPTDSRYSRLTLVAPDHVESGTGRLLPAPTAAEQGAISGKYLCRPGDVIYSKIRPSLRKACLAPHNDVLCSADMYAITPTKGVLSKFLLFFLLSEPFVRFTELESDRVAMPKVNQETLKKCWIPLPPVEVQASILEQADVELQAIDTLIDEGRRLMHLLRERRSSLITAAVTGQIDVGGWRPIDEPSIEVEREALP